MSRADELRALAERYDSVEANEATYNQAVEAYRADPTDEVAQADYESAAAALRDSREGVRGDLMVASSEPGSSSIGVVSINVGSAAGAPTVENQEG